MVLPVINVPTFTTKLPSGREIRIRSYTVREEKILLIGAEERWRSAALQAIIQVVQNCVVDKDVDVTKLPIFDFEYLFLFLRSRSVSEKIKIKAKVNDTDDDFIAMEINLNDIRVVKPEGKPKDVIKINNEITVKLRYPTVDSLFLSMKDEKKIDPYAIVADAIGVVAKGEETWTRDDFDAKEANDFVMNFSTENMIEVKEFLDTAPKIVADAVYVDDKGKKGTKEIEGILNFLG